LGAENQIRKTQERRRRRQEEKGRSKDEKRRRGATSSTDSPVILGFDLEQIGTESIVAPSLSISYPVFQKKKSPAIRVGEVLDIATSIYRDLRTFSCYVFSETALYYGL
jgi:hypothetical protein